MFHFLRQSQRFMIVAMIAVGMAIAISSFGVVRAAHINPLRIFTCSSGTACVEGSATGATTWGVYGTATNTDGVHGVTSTTTGGSGVAGISMATSGTAAYGVYGSSHNGVGVYGKTTLKGGIGVEGDSGPGTTSALSVGVLGQNKYENGSGVEGVASGGSGFGVFGVGTASYGAGVEGYIPAGNSTGLAVVGFTDDKSALALDVGGPYSGGQLSVDYYGNGVFSGTVTASGFDTDVRRPDGSRVIASASLAPRATIEDAGTARLIDGVGIVHLERDFASTIDSSKGYQVFLTPDGDTRGWLYVAAKYQGGFIVREAEHGRSSIYFDYRVLAHPAGSSDERFPVYNPKQPPRLKLPVHPQQAHLASGG